MKKNSKSNPDLSNPIMENLLIEQMILGSLLQNNDMFEQISDVIDWHHFADPTNQIIFLELKDRIMKGSLGNIITLSQTLSKQNVDNNYLKDLTKHMVSYDNIREYGQIIREMYIKRTAFALGEEMKLKASEEDFLEKGIYKIEEKLYSLSTATSDRHTTISFQDGVVNVQQHLSQILNSNKKLVGLTTGFIDIDAKLGGLHGGYLYILAARPSMGKSAFAGNIGVNCALNKEYGGPVGFISLEMPYSQIVLRIVSSLTNVPLNNLINCHINKQDFYQCFNQLKEFNNLPFYIHDTSTISIGEIRTVLRQMKRKWGIKLGIIDYLQLIHGGGSSGGENRVSEISRITRQLKGLAKELDIPIIVLSQLSRATEKGEGHRPQLWQLRESGSIEQDADVVMFLLRKSYYDAKDASGTEENSSFSTISKIQNLEMDLTDIFIDKNRNGATGQVQILYNAYTTCFKNYMR